MDKKPIVPDGVSHVVWEVLAPRLGEAPHYAAEIGCADGMYGSQGLGLERLGWEVVAVEANPYYAKAAGERRKRFVEAACSDETGEREFTIFRINGGNMTAVSSLRPDVTKAKQHERMTEGKEVVTVKARKLDDILEEQGFPRLDFLQIDVEGGEMAVLRGTNLLKWRPHVIQIENWYNSQELKDYLRAQGYSLYMRVVDDDYYARD